MSVVHNKRGLEKYMEYTRQLHRKTSGKNIPNKYNHIAIIPFFMCREIKKEKWKIPQKCLQMLNNKQPISTNNKLDEIFCDKHRP